MTSIQAVQTATERAAERGLAIEIDEPTNTSVMTQSSAITPFIVPSSAIANQLAIDAMRNPPVGDGLVCVFGQAAQAISRLSTGVLLKGADVAAPILVRSVRGSLEAVAAHYPSQLQELAVIAEQGQQKFQALTAHVGDMGDRYALNADYIERQWDMMSHSIQELQTKAQQAKTHIVDIKQGACRSALQTGVVIGSLYALSYAVNASGWDGSSAKYFPSVGSVAAAVAGKMIYDCCRSEPFRQLSKVCAEMYSELIQMGQMGIQLSNDLIATSAAVLRDTSFLMSEVKSAGLIPNDG